MMSIDEVRSSDASRLSSIVRWVMELTATTASSATTNDRIQGKGSGALAWRRLVRGGIWASSSAGIREAGRTGRCPGHSGGDVQRVV
jgi:hypothetical protein